MAYNKLKKSYGETNDLNLNSIIAISRTAQLIQRKAAKDFRDSGLTLAQFGVLEVLYHKGDLSISEIIDKTLSTSGNMTVIVDNLCKLGLTLKKECPNDRRITKVSITEKGQSVIESVFPIHLKSMEKLFNPLTNDEKAILICLMKKLTNYSST